MVGICYPVIGFSGANICLYVYWLYYWKNFLTMGATNETIRLSKGWRALKERFVVHDGCDYRLKATLGGQFARQDSFPETDGKIP